MKKNWNTPKIEVLDISATAFDPNGGTVADLYQENLITHEYETYYQPSGAATHGGLPDPETVNL